jgi:hypothetical protein
LSITAVDSCVIVSVFFPFFHLIVWLNESRGDCKKKLVLSVAGTKMSSGHISLTAYVVLYSRSAHPPFASAPSFDTLRACPSPSDLIGGSWCVIAWVHEDGPASAEPASPSILTDYAFIESIADINGKSLQDDMSRVCLYTGSATQTLWERMRREELF